MFRPCVLMDEQSVESNIDINGSLKEIEPKADYSEAVEGMGTAKIMNNIIKDLYGRMIK